MKQSDYIQNKTTDWVQWGHHSLPVTPLETLPPPTMDPGCCDCQAASASFRSYLLSSPPGM